MCLFPFIREVLHTLGEVGMVTSDKIKAQMIVYLLESFQFVFLTHLMLTILGFTKDLNMALQRKDQDLVNAMSLVQLTKSKLQNMRECGWHSLMDKISLFYGKHAIAIPEMKDLYTPWGHSKRSRTNVPNKYHFRFEVFLKVLDQQLLKLNNRFDEINTELFICMAALSPRNSFSSFEKEKIMKLATLYPLDFSQHDLIALDFQLHMFIDDMRLDNVLFNLTELGELSLKVVRDKEKSYMNLCLFVVKIGFDSSRSYC